MHYFEQVEMPGKSLRLLAAKALLDFVGTEGMQAEATNLLVRGMDSPSIRHLAGMSTADNDEVRAVFRTVLRELGIDSPSPREAVILVATEVASRITTGVMSPYDGAKEIWNIAVRLPLEHFPEFDAFVYAASEWEERPEDEMVFAEGIVAAARDLVGANS
jgi:hypothetical protein